MNLVQFYIEQEAVARAVLAGAVLIIGMICANLFSKMVLRLQLKKTNGKKIAVDWFTRSLRDVIVILTILVALFLLHNRVLSFDWNYYFEALTPVFSLILVLLLAYLVGNVIVMLAMRFLQFSGIKAYFTENKLDSVYRLVLLVFKGIVYLFVFFVSVNLVLPNRPGILQVLNTTFFYVMGVVILLVLIASRDLLKNAVSGLYLMITHDVREGQSVTFDGKSGYLSKIGYVNSVVVTEKGYEFVIPNGKFISDEFVRKSIKEDLMTLEKIKQQFVAQKPSFCGPASAEIILSIFGHKVSQDRIGELCNTRKGVGTAPRDIVNAVEGETQKKVRGAWIGADHIGDFKEELREWLKDGGLLIIDFFKPKLFAEARAGHYVVCVAVEGNELVILDPSSKKGGVYLVDVDKMWDAVNTYSKVLKEKRGYIVFAPKGTPAYYRIQKGRIYAPTGIARDVQNLVAGEFNKFYDKTESFVPASIREFFEKYKKKDKIVRVWIPKPVGSGEE